MSASFLALVVVYGREPAETPTLHSLARCSLERCDLRTIVWDNSPKPTEINESAPGLPVEYVSTPENLGLSAIYNRVSATRLRLTDRLPDMRYLLYLVDPRARVHESRDRADHAA